MYSLGKGFFGGRSPARRVSFTPQSSTTTSQGHDAVPSLSYPSPLLSFSLILKHSLPYFCRVDRWDSQVPAWGHGPERGQLDPTNHDRRDADHRHRLGPARVQLDRLERWVPGPQAWAHSVGMFIQTLFQHNPWFSWTLLPCQALLCHGFNCWHSLVACAELVSDSY